jgi:RNA polymerase sigma factor FliA
MKHDKEHLILDHLDLAKSIALSEWRTATHALDKDDMLGLAYTGLVDAANRWQAYCEKKNFDPSAVQYFKVFARLRIRGTIRDQIRKDDWTTRTVRTKSKKLKDAGQDEGISVEELSQRTDMSVTEINKVQARLAQRPVSLDSSLALADNEVSNFEVHLKEDVDTEGAAFANEMITVFVSALGLLDIETQIIIAMHYYSKISLDEIASELGLNTNEVEELHRQAVYSIKDAMTKAATERG